MSASSPRVSVVIPSYNYARFLPFAIRSVLGQSFLDFEIVVIDDGSTDETRNVLVQFTDSRLRYIYQNNAGLSAARNTGIKTSRGDFIGFLDADDQWLPGTLRCIMDKFASIAPEFAVVATGTARVDDAGNKLPEKRNSVLVSQEMTARDFVMKNRPLSSSVVIKREAFTHCGDFDTSLRSSEDRDMWIRIASRFRVFYMAEPLALLRRHPNNMSKHADRMKLNTKRVLLKAFRNGAVPRWDVAFWLLAFSTYFFQIAWTHFDEERRIAAICYIITSLLLWPFPMSRIGEPAFFRVRALARFLVPFDRRPGDSSSSASSRLHSILTL